MVAESDRAYLRTARHPAAVAFPGLESFDSLYERAVDFDSLYSDIVDVLIGAAEQAGRHGGYVAYAVPGSPLVAEETVDRLRRDARVSTDVRPALSFLDLVWQRLGIDPVTAGVRLTDATDFARQAGSDGPLLVTQCWSRSVLSEIKLAIDQEASERLSPITVLQRLGLVDERIWKVRWHELDHIEPDHLTSLWIPPLAEPVGAEFVALDDLARRLRRDCPWDREQTHQSLRRHLLEECYEVLDAIDDLQPIDGDVRHGDVRPAHGDQPVAASKVEPEESDHLCEELGDLLFQVILHSRLASEEGLFTLSDVARAIREKLIARHPHVFGDFEAETAQAVAANWEVLKAHEKGRSSVLQGIPKGLPALSLASELLQKSRRVEPSLPQSSDLMKPGGALAGIADMKLRDVLDADHLGAKLEQPKQDKPDAGLVLAQLLFALCHTANHFGVDPELALRSRARQFAAAVAAIESERSG